MDGFKTFYNEKNGKYILFFGFYLIFFIVLSIYMRSLDANKPEEANEEKNEIITTYDLSKLTNNDFQYDILVNDDDSSITFSGTKSNIDYANYENKYFFDIYNINQLLKKSKLLNSENYVLTYELSNSEIDDILLTNSDNGVNEIKVYVNEDTTVNQIDINLSAYLKKDNYVISIKYNIGDNNENSSS